MFRRFTIALLLYKLLGISTLCLLFIYYFYLNPVVLYSFESLIGCDAAVSVLTRSTMRGNISFLANGEITSSFYTVPHSLKGIDKSSSPIHAQVNRIRLAGACTSHIPIRESVKHTNKIHVSARARIYAETRCYWQLKNGLIVFLTMKLFIKFSSRNFV